MSGLATAVLAIVIIEHGVPEVLAIGLVVLFGLAVGNAGHDPYGDWCPSFVMTLAGFIGWQGPHLSLLSVSGVSQRREGVCWLRRSEVVRFCNGAERGEHARADCHRAVRIVGRRLVTGRRDGGAAGGEAPGRPGAHPLWLPAGKTGFGGSRDKASNVWFTLHNGLWLTKDGNANAGTAYDLGNSSVSTDQRAVADAGFLELVRLGIYAPDDPVIRNSIEVTDKAISYTTPTGQFWHCYTGDGYGERPDRPDGSQWEMDLPPGSRQIFGRLWPLLADERGEYELANGDLGSAKHRLRDLARVSGIGGTMPE